MDVTLTRSYVCQIRAHRHINMSVLEPGYLNEINVKEGQTVKQGDLMFKTLPILKMVKPNAESASVRAPFDGIIDRMNLQLGSLIKEGDTVTTLSDNSVMWVYFNVSQQGYLEYMANRRQHDSDTFELVLADRTTFPQPGKFGAIEAQFNERSGTISFRADFPNPDRLLRHGQSGTILVRRKLNDAIVIPQQATFEIKNKRYVYVVDKDDVVHQREIVPEDELDDTFVIKKGLGVDDRIVLEGVRQVRNGAKVKFDFRPIEEVIPKLKKHSE